MIRALWGLFWAHIEEAVSILVDRAAAHLHRHEGDE